MAQTTYLQTEILLKDIVNYQNSMETFSLMLKDSEEKYSTTLSEVLSAVRDHQNEMRKRLNSSGYGSNVTANNNSHNNQQQPEVTMMMTNGLVKTSQQQQHRSANGESKQVRKALRSILVMQDEVWGILHENTKLIEQFTHLAVTSSSSSTSSLDENSQQILEDLQAAVLTNNY